MPRISPLIPPELRLHTTMIVFSYEKGLRKCQNCNEVEDRIGHQKARSSSRPLYVCYLPLGGCAETLVHSFSLSIRRLRRRLTRANAAARGHVPPSFCTFR